MKGEKKKIAIKFVFQGKVFDSEQCQDVTVGYPNLSDPYPVFQQAWNKQFVCF